MKRLTILLILLINFSALDIYAQVDEVPDQQIQNQSNQRLRNDPSLKEQKKLKLDNWFVGSGLSMQFWGNQFRFDLLPYFGYRIGNVLAPGIGFNYIFLSDFSNTNQNTNYHLYGPKIFLRLRPFVDLPVLSQIYIHGEYEYYTAEVYENNSRVFSLTGQQRINAGIGYTSNFDKGFGITTEFLFDFYRLIGSSIFYQSPFIYRLGIYYGF
jgi:hypothetical protein